jgi:ceramide glucosyltransferase
MLPQARFEYLIVNDSDINLQPDYLRRVMAPFADHAVGMVTCLYRGIASSTIGSKFEALGISTDLAAGVLTARILEGVKFGLGSTLAFSRESLKTIGGFEALVDHLADDYELGNRIARLGKKVVVSDVVVDHHLPAYTFGEFLDHQLRWSRAIRDSRKLGYLGTIVTFGVPWALLTILLGGAAAWTLEIAAATFLIRYVVAYQLGWGVLHDRQLSRDWWLLPIRDVVALAVFMASFAGHTVVWRGEKFLLRNGKLSRIPPERGN